MGLKLYHDQAGTNEITDQNPSVNKGSVLVGATMTSVIEIWAKSADGTLTYEDIEITASGDEGGATESGEVDITYSSDGETYVQVLELPAGDYATANKIYCKAVAPNMAEPFNRTDIQHEWSFNSYKK